MTRSDRVAENTECSICKFDVRNHRMKQPKHRCIVSRRAERIAHGLKSVKAKARKKRFAEKPIKIGGFAGNTERNIAKCRRSASPNFKEGD